MVSLTPGPFNLEGITLFNIEQGSSEMKSLPVWEKYHILLSGIYHIVKIYFTLGILN